MLTYILLSSCWPVSALFPRPQASYKRLPTRTPNTHAPVLAQRTRTACFIGRRAACWAAGTLVGMLSLTPLAHASLSLDRTRVIYEEQADEKGQPQKNAVSVTISNNNQTLPYLGHASVWSDRENKEKTPLFNALPPLQRIDPAQKAVVRIEKLPEQSLPKDRESVFYLAVQEVPPKTEDVKKLLAEKTDASGTENALARKTEASANATAQPPQDQDASTPVEKNEHASKPDASANTTAPSPQDQDNRTKARRSKRASETEASATAKAPPAQKNENSIQIAIRSIIKLFYRPHDVASPPPHDPARDLEIHIDAGKQQLVFANPTPYHISIISATLEGDKKPLPLNLEKLSSSSKMLLPKEKTLLPHLPTLAFKRLTLSHINDYGGVNTLSYQCVKHTCLLEEKE